MFNQLSAGVFKVWPHRRIITRADVDGVSEKFQVPVRSESLLRAELVDEVTVSRAANLIDRETALLYGYVFLGVAHKPTADNHVRKLVQLARDPEKHQLTTLINVVIRVRAKWQSRVMDDLVSVETAIQETNSSDDVWLAKTVDKSGDHMPERSGTQHGKGKGKGKGVGSGKDKSGKGSKKRKNEDNWGSSSWQQASAPHQKWQRQDWSQGSQGYRY